MEPVVTIETFFLKNSHLWKLEQDDEVRSAWILLEEHRSLRSETSGGSLGGIYSVVEPITIEEETGVTAIAFILPRSYYNGEARGEYVSSRLQVCM